MTESTKLTQTIATENAGGKGASLLKPLAIGLFGVVILVAIATGLRDQWKPYVFPVQAPSDPTANQDEEQTESPTANQSIMLSDQAQKNLHLVAKPLKAETFWKTISVPGMVIDRPGFSDRGIVAPVTSIVSRIHRVAGDTVKQGEILFSLKLLSESLHQTQTDLFKATQDIKLAKTQRDRLVASAGVVPESRIIEIDNQITRLQVGVKAYRQELFNRGLSSDKIDEASEGKFVNEISIVVPDRPVEANPLSIAQKQAAPQTSFEIQELKVELGQQVLAGQTLCLIANHQMLAVEGRAFRNESALLEQTVKEGWPVQIDFAEESRPDWPEQKQDFRVTYIANSIDPESRTFRFLIPLDNQSRSIDKDGRSQLLWRYRPGQRVRLQIRTEAIANVFILPVDSLASEGAETYLFRQNGNIFERKPVQVVYRDRRFVVVANDGSIPPGIYVAQTGGPQLNRMIKSQSNTMPKGFHIHADGSVHMGHH